MTVEATNVGWPLALPLNDGLARGFRSALYSAHHGRTTATRNLSPGCIVSPVGRPRLERGGRRFESCHPDQYRSIESIPTQLLTLHHGADAYSVGHAAVTRRSASSVVVRIHVAPPNTAGLGHWLASSLPSCPKLGSIPATRSTDQDRLHSHTASGITTRPNGNVVKLRMAWLGVAWQGVARHGLKTAGSIELRCYPVFSD